MLDKEKLTKIMMLSTSDADGESLNAIRMANRMIKSVNLNWESILTKSSFSNNNDSTLASLRATIRQLRADNELNMQEANRKIAELRRKLDAKESANKDKDPFSKFFEQGNNETGPSIDYMLNTCLEEVQGTAHDFIESLAEAYKKYRRLTPKQEAALRRFYSNL